MPTRQSTGSAVAPAIMTAAATAAVAVLVFTFPTHARAQASAATATAASSTFTPNVKPVLTLSKAPGAITIDGNLNDFGWSTAQKAGNFAEHFPEEAAEPEVQSEVWVTYDDNNLYLAFLAADDPSGIRASLRDRDEMWSDDYFGILLDTYGDAAWAYFLFANPLGVQGDSRFATAGGEDDGFDIIFSTEGLVTDSGYQLEMAIPFASLRFPNRPVQTWRATFWRTRPRASREQHSWAVIDRDDPCFLCQFGTLTGIEGVSPGGALEILPTVVASQAGALTDPSSPVATFDNAGITGDIALDLKYSFASGLTAEGSVNPDFSQVESDVAQIDVNTTFALFFPERRPFFQEGSDLFRTFFNSVYTRQINNPQFATKLVGRMGRTTVAYMGARDEDSPILLPFEERSYVGRAKKSVSNIARFRQTFLEDSYVGVLLTDRRLDGGGSGSVASVDGTFRFLDKYRFEYQLLGSYTREPDDTSLTAGVNGLTFDGGKRTAAFDGESFTGFAQYTSLERSARTWNFDIDYWSASPTFRADNGFENRNAFRRISMWQALLFYPTSSFVDQIRPGVFAQRTWNFDGAVKRTFIEPGIAFQFKRQTFVNVWANFGDERFADVDFNGLRRVGIFVNSAFSDPVRLGFVVQHGRSVFRDRSNPLLGSGTDAEIFATIKPAARLVIEPSVNYSTLSELHGDREFFSGFILRTRTNLQFSRELFVRVVIQYNDFSNSLDIEPLLTYKLNPFSLFYIGSSLAYRDFDDPRGMTRTSRQFFTKFQYLFRR